MFTRRKVDLSLVGLAVRRHVRSASGGGQDQSLYDGCERDGGGPACVPVATAA